MRRKFSLDAAELLALLDKENAGAAVIGLPINMDGSEGPRAQKSRAFVRNMAQLSGLPFAFWDERLSTVAAGRTLIEMDFSRRKRAGKIDMLGFVVWSALVPPIPLIALSLLTEGAAADWAALSHPSWLLAGIVGFNAYAATLIGFGLWSVLLARYPASTVVPFSLLVPVVGITSGVLLLGETMSLTRVIGTLLVVLGVVLTAQS